LLPASVWEAISDSTSAQFAIRAANQVQIGWPLLRHYSPERFFQKLFRPLPTLRAHTREFLDISTGGRPIPLHGSRSNFQYLRNLLQGEPGKEAQFYNSALARVDFGETYKSINRRRGRCACRASNCRRRAGFRGQDPPGNWKNWPTSRGNVGATRSWQGF